MYGDPNKGRLKEILAVIHKHNLARGVSPEKIRLILEDLGPTYVKLGQILSMRSDILPKEICDELLLLQSDVAPMSYAEVKSVIQEAYGVSLGSVFESFDKEPIGSASIAQVHTAVLQSTGEKVVVKVQRCGIYETMSKDMAFLHRALRVVPAVNMKGLVDLNKVLDEMWMVAQDEMNFLVEAKNMEEFATRNRDVAFVYVPKLYREFTTPQVLVMEYIDGVPVDDKKRLLEEGYDLDEIAAKMADNYIKQIMDDGYFHADPHPGNVFVRDGKIVWLDMGMMGRFSHNDQVQIAKAISGVAVHDVSDIVDAVLAIGEFHEPPDQKQLYSDISMWLAQYGSAGFGSLNMGQMMQDIADIMKKNNVSLPHNLTMLVRGLTTIEGVIAKISPDTNLITVAAAHISGSRLENFDLKELLKDGGTTLWRALHKSIEIPSYVADLLHSYTKGQTRINLDLHTTDDLNQLAQSVTRHIVVGLLIAALLISSSIICVTDMNPKILGIPALGVIGFVLAFVLAVVIFLEYFRQRRRKKRRRR